MSWNKGSAAQVISVVCSLRKVLPKAEFTLLSYFPEMDSEQCSRYGIKVLGFSRHRYRKHRTLLLIYSLNLIFTFLNCILFSLFRILRLNNRIKLIGRNTKEFVESDLILDLSGDSFSDWKNLSIINVLALLPAIVLKKKFLFFSQSIGPFYFWMLPIAKFCLNLSNLIVIREDVTKNYLRRIGINNKNLVLAADCAFLLEPILTPKVLEVMKNYHISENKHSIFGVSVSVFMANHSFKEQNIDYLSIMSKLVDYLIESKNAYVILVPHVIAPIEWGTDDIYAIKKVYKLVENKKKVILVDNSYDSRELKGIIGFCDLFIGCRMHANIAALSQNIPTIAVGWSHKYYGIMKRVGLEDYVCYLKNLDFNEIKEKVDMLFIKKEKIRKKLISETIKERNSALDTIKLINDFLAFYQNG